MKNPVGAWMLGLATACAGPVAAQDALPAAPEPDYTIHAQPIDLNRQPEEPAPRPAYGDAGTEWFSVGFGVAHDLSNATDINIRLAYSQFLVDNFEFALDLRGWYFEQEGQNAAGINPGMNFRWHFYNEDPWTVFADLGIGVLLTTDSVPDGGTSFDFTPGAGVGLTRRINDAGTRLEAGLRWHHISNGRISGDERNPSRDAPLFYVGLQMPF